MAKVRMAMDYAVSAEELWKMVGAFGGLSNWHPAIQESKLQGDEGSEGTVRHLALVGGGEVVERLEKISDTERVYRYSILSGPIPVADYEAEIRVTDNGDGTCEVEWSSEFKPKGVPETDAIKSIEGIYQAGLDNLKKLYGMK